MRRIAVPLVVVLSIALLAWLFRGERPPRLAVQPAAPRSVADQPSEPPAAVEATAVAAREPLPDSPAERAAPPPVADSEAVAPSTTSDYPGRIVLRDVEGHPIAAGSGILEGWLKSTGSSFGSGPIAVHEGSFRLPLPDRCGFVPSRLDLNDELVWTDATAVELDSHGELVIEARRVPPMRLHVVDANTQQDLEGVDVVALAGGVFDGVDQPGEIAPEDRLVVDGRSPLTLAPRLRHGDIRWTLTVAVHAPGYAWRLLPLDFARGGDEIVALDRGADLDVTIAGEFERGEPGPLRWDDSRPQLRVRHLAADSEPALDRERLLERARAAIAELDEEERDELFPDGVVPDESMLLEFIEAQREAALNFRAMARLIAQRLPEPAGATRFKGLPLGRVLVALEQGEHWSNPRVLAESVIELTAGTTSAVQLQVRPDDRPAGVPLAGRIRLSPSWNDSDPLDLCFEPIAVPGATSAEEFNIDVKLIGSPDGPEWHRFDAGRRLPGRWLVTSYAYDFQVMVDTGPAGRSDAEIVIGDPADAWIKLIDASSGQTIAVEDKQGLHWWCQRPAESNGGSLESARFNEPADAWYFRAPEGRVGLSLRDEAGLRYREPDDWVVTLSPGRNDLTFTLQRVQSLELRFELDGRPLPESTLAFQFEIDSSSARAINTANGKKLRGSRWSRSKLWFTFPKPGRWRIEVAPLPGYASVEPFELDIAEGELVVHRLALVREE